MPGSRSEQVKSIFVEALDHSASDRASFLDRACGGDAELRAEVQKYLADHMQAGEFLAGPGLTRDAVTVEVSSVALAEGPGTIIGRYKLLQKIGEGGFGVVFMAEQEKPVRRNVALKVIKLGMDTREVVARFEAERQALAMMDHPNIAKVLDAGSTDTGRPYFVMELVRGSPITEYCDKRKLVTNERVALLAQVCRAVQHAHSKGIIHRDLKPSNVLVTIADDKPIPKVIDFGIAKATQSKLTERTLFTAFRQMIGTPQYMSPEQADSDGVDVDTRTDVYSLGVLLYELLVGTTPFDARSLRSAAFEEMRRIIRDVEPPRPSTRLNTMAGEAMTAVAIARGTEPKRLGQIVHGELDWIVMKALEKDRSRRYETAAAMADDLLRYLAGEAVLAGPVSGVYRLKKTLMRHRTAVAVGFAIAAVLLMGIIGTAIGLARETRQRHLADKARAESQRQQQIAEQQTKVAELALDAEASQRRRAEARFADVRVLANDFMFKFDDALANVAGATPARKMLAETALKYLDRLNNDAAFDKTLSRDLANSYAKVGDILGGQAGPNLGDSDGALASYRKYQEICQRLAHDDPADLRAQLDLVASYERIGNTLVAKGLPDDALISFGRGLEIGQKLAEANPKDATAQRDLAILYDRIENLQFSNRRYDDALVIWEKAMKIGQKLASDNPTDVNAQIVLANHYDKLGDIQVAKGQIDAALESCNKSLSIRQSIVAADPSNAQAQRSLAISYIMIGDALKSKRLFDPSLESYKKALTIDQAQVHDDPLNATAQRDLSQLDLRIGDMYLAKGQRDDALPYFLRYQEISKKLAEADPGNYGAQFEYSVSYLRIGDIQAYKKQLEDALESYRKFEEIQQKLANEHPQSIAILTTLDASLARLGKIQLDLGKFDDAMATCQQRVEILLNLCRTNPGNAEPRRFLGYCYEKIGDIQVLNAKLDDAMASYQQALSIRLKLAQNDPDKARGKSELLETCINASWGCLVLKDFDRALSWTLEGEKIDPGSLALESNQAHALLFGGQESKAKAIYLKHLREKMPGTDQVWEDANLADFAELEKHGVTSPGTLDVRQMFQSARASRPAATTQAADVPNVPSPPARKVQVKPLVDWPMPATVPATRPAP